MTPYPRRISLPNLFQDVPFEALSPVPELTVEGISSDSRLVKAGDLFVALAGGAVDGHSFIADALAKGAAAVVGTRPQIAQSVPYIQVSDSRQALPYLAAAFYGSPARKMTVIGVTGTDGKTTTSNLIFHILKAAGVRAGMISTVNAVIGEASLDTGFHVTTPDPLDVQKYLAEMVNANLTHVVLETTSHGLAQYRVDACEFDVSVVTNITHEHLDYHGSYDAYRAAKARLFSMTAETRSKTHNPPSAGVLNRDDGSFEFLEKMAPLNIVSYGVNPEATVRASQVVHTPDGIQFKAIGPGFETVVTSSLVGHFNVSNCLAAIAVTSVVLGIDIKHAVQGIADMQGVPGRMERQDLGQDFTAIVDFAHTPNALRVTLQTAREMSQRQDKPGRVIAVFGSAGLRDRAKRRMMAEVSADLADLTILTAEDPRTESLEGILAEMAAGMVGRGGVEGKTFWRIPDRGEAIRFAVALAQPGDILLACGKGHEQSMCFGTVEYDWDDRLALQAALAERLGIQGPAMPSLPTSPQ